MTDTVKILREAARAFMGMNSTDNYLALQHAIVATERAAIQPAGDGWHEGAPSDAENGFYAFHPDLIDPDFNPHGVVEAVVSGDSFIGAIWNNCHDCWDALPIKVAMWRKITGPSAAPVCTPVQAAPDANPLHAPTKKPCAFCGLTGQHDFAYPHPRTSTPAPAVQAAPVEASDLEFTMAVPSKAHIRQRMQERCEHDYKHSSGFGGDICAKCGKIKPPPEAPEVKQDASALPSIGDEAEFRRLRNVYVMTLKPGLCEKQSEQDECKKAWKAFVAYIDARTPPVAAAPQPDVNARVIRVLTGLRDGWATRKDADDAISMLQTAAAPESAEPSARSES